MNDITQSIKLVEKLKSELLTSVADLYSNMLSPNDDERVDIFADIIIFTYILANKLGINNNTIDAKIVNKLKLSILEDNILYTELVGLLKHIDKK